MRLLLSLLFVLVFLGGCKKDSDLVAPNVVQAQVLGRTWFESYEEELAGSDVRVYRPKGFAFPTIWVRDGFLFEAGNVFTSYRPGPADGMVTYPGRWQTVSPDQFRITLNGQPGSYVLQLISVDNDVLRLRRLP